MHLQRPRIRPLHSWRKVSGDAPQKECGADVCECQFHIEDLYDLVFPDGDVEGHLCMVFQCFLDDSKDQFRDRVFVSAGFFGRREDWKRLRSSWRKCLNHNGIKYFKTSEYKMLEGE